MGGRFVFLQGWGILSLSCSVEVFGDPMKTRLFLARHGIVFLLTYETTIVQVAEELYTVDMTFLVGAGDSGRGGDAVPECNPAISIPQKRQVRRGRVRG